MLWYNWNRDRTWDLYRDFDRLHEEMGRIFGGRGGARQTRDLPQVNLWTNSNGATVSAEMPGVDPKEIDISVVGDTLTVRGSRTIRDLAENETYHRQERAYGQFTRTVQLPFTIDSGRVDARYNRGILHVTLPKTAQESAKKITVKAS